MAGEVGHSLYFVNVVRSSPALSSGSLRAAPALVVVMVMNSGCLRPNRGTVCLALRGPNHDDRRVLERGTQFGGKREGA